MSRFSRGSDYKTEFNNAVSELITVNIEDRQERIEAINLLVDAYIEGIGEVPESDQLERLTDYILREELTENGGGHKVTNTEYPFLSAWQLQLRRDREYGLDIAEETATDGKSHKPPHKRHRTSYERFVVDKYAKSRNEERRKQYRKDSANGELVTMQVDPEALGRYLTETYGDWKLKYSR